MEILQFKDVVIKVTGTNDSPILNTVLETTYTDTNVDDTFESYNWNFSCK